MNHLCDMCGGESVALGALGGTVHLRCRACGWQQEAVMEGSATLWEYRTGAYIRPATRHEWASSMCAGDTGVIEVEVDGETVAAFVN